MKNNYKGDLIDNRSSGKQKKDYLFNEISLGSKKWLSKKEAKKSEKLFTNRDQKSTSSCVCFATCTVLENTEKEVLSPAFLYSQRWNKPQEGSYYYDIGNIVVSQGVPREILCPTATKEIEINNTKITAEAKADAKKYRQKSFIFKNDPTIEEVKDIVNSGIALVGSIYATRQEWSKSTVKVITKDLKYEQAEVNHAIALLPNGAFKDKKEFFIKCQDSAKFGGITFRDLDSEFIEKRLNLTQAYVDLEYKDLAKIVIPQELKGYQFSRELNVGSVGGDVRKLQSFLQANGYFPSTINGKKFDVTDYYGGITRQAVKDFQEAYPDECLRFWNLSTGTGIFGTQTKAFVNKLLSQ